MRPSTYTYIDEVLRLLRTVEDTQVEVIKAAAELVAEAMANNHLLHVFGTGHGHILAEELFYRAGGLLPINPILDSGLMLHEAALASSQLERLPGYAQVVLSSHNLEPGDVMLVASSSGINSVPVEAALYAKERGLKVIALTSIAHSQSALPRHPSGKKLYARADVVIDNCGIPGDAILEVEGLPGRICPTSTVIGAALLHWLEHEVVQNLLERGIIPEIVISANVPGGDDNNAAGFACYRSRVRCL
jgi:uncharacterized phosphosugar-binding protein